MSAAMRNFLCSLIISRIEEIPNPSPFRNLIGIKGVREEEKLRSTAQMRAQTATSAFRQMFKGTPTPITLVI
jgi:hypothetical protein